MERWSASLRARFLRLQASKPSSPHRNARGIERREMACLRQPEGTARRRRATRVPPQPAVRGRHRRGCRTLHRGPKALHKPAQGKQAGRVMAASHFTRARAPPWVVHPATDKAPRGRDKVWPPLQGFVILRTKPRAASAEDADLPWAGLSQAFGLMRRRAASPSPAAFLRRPEGSARALTGRGKVVPRFSVPRWATAACGRIETGAHVLLRPHPLVRTVLHAEAWDYVARHSASAARTCAAFGSSIASKIASAAAARAMASGRFPSELCRTAEFHSALPSPRQ